MYPIAHTDIDECTNGTHNCQQTCTNTPGSFVCGCLDGFVLDANGQNCTGTYVCMYVGPFSIITVLYSPNHCLPVCCFPVSIYPIQSDCDVVLVDTSTKLLIQKVHSSAVCHQCPFTICTHVHIRYPIAHPTDIDECTNGTDDCQHTCTNTLGSFVCGCYSGFTLDANGVNCTGRCMAIISEHAPSQVVLQWYKAQQ